MADVVFLDFEASSLDKRGYPIEVAWVFATGGEEAHLIRPAPDWTDWASDAEAIHGIPRDRLVAEGEPVVEVAGRMVEVLTGHSLYATAPSWDGQWMSRLLRAGGLPRHALRLEDTEVAHRRAAMEILEARAVPSDQRETIAGELLAAALRQEEGAGPPLHRALADARREREIWRNIRRLAEGIAMRPPDPGI